VLQVQVLHLPGASGQDKDKALTLTDLLDKPGLERADQAMVGSEHLDFFGRLKNGVKGQKVLSRLWPLKKEEL